MKFTVTVITSTHRYRFSAIGQSSFAVLDAATEQFGDLCCVSVICAEVKS